MKANVLSRVKKFKKSLIRDYKRLFRPSKKNYHLPFSDDHMMGYWAMFMIFS